MKIEAGKTTRAEFKLMDGVRVRGVVREKGAGKPVEGVGIGCFRVDQGGRTDASGRFTFYAPPGRALLQLQSLPKGYAGFMYGLPDVTIPKDVADFELPPIELNRAGIVQGVVVNAQARPVAGATVKAWWQVDEGPRREGRQEMAVTTDSRGAFSVPGVPSGTAVTLSANAPVGGGIVAPVTTTAGQPGERVTLALDPRALVAMKGRVLDAMGTPVAGARIHIRRQQRYPSGQIKGDVAVGFDGAYVLRADAQGRFETPRGLEPEVEYAAIGEDVAHGAGQTPWTIARDGAFPDLVLGADSLPRRTALEGFVRDKAARPVPGAEVWASFPGGPVKPTHVVTTAQGLFRIENVPETGSLLLVEAKGFRFRGFAASPGHPPLNLFLTRETEAPAGMTTLPPPLPWAEEKALARRVIVPFAERAMKEGRDEMYAAFSALTVMAEVEPGRVLEIVAGKPFKTDWFNDRLRVTAALASVDDGLDRALAAAETIDSPEQRSYTFANLVDRLPISDRAGKLRLLDRALLAAREVKEAGHRVVAVSRVAEGWFDLEETDRATELLREFEAAARELPKQGWDSYARGHFAEDLARIDLEAALKLIDGLDNAQQSEPDRYLLNIAQRLAPRDPAAAERVLGGLKRPSSIVRHGPRIAHAMAPKDPSRARRIVDTMSKYPDETRNLPFHHAYALGMMALALADSNKGAAKSLLDEAYAELARLAPEGKRGFQDTEDAATVAAALVPVAERVDPSTVPERFWRAASWRGMSSATSRPRTMPDAILALLLARYDREAALAILEPIVAGGLSKEGAAPYFTLQAMAAVDPKRAVTLLDTVPDDPDAGLNPFRNPKNEVKVALATALVTRPEKRWDRVLEKLLHLWTVGRNDIF